MAGSVLVLLTVSGVLYLFFALWRAGYSERASFGAREVVPAIDPLFEKRPPGIAPQAWSQAVADTRTMLSRLTSSGALDMPKLQRLRAELAARAAGARPETAALELTGIWMDMEDRARPLLVGTRYPELLALAIAIGPLSRKVPQGVEPSAWARALDETRVMLIAVSASGELGPDQLHELNRKLVTSSSTMHPEEAQGKLSQIWDELAARAPRVVARMHRPELIALPAGQ